MQHIIRKGVLRMELAKVNIEKLEALLRQAGELFQDREAAGCVKIKGEADYVTEVDYRVQQFIRGRLEADYPQVQFLSEEKTNQEIDKSGLVWILDPVEPPI